MPYRVVFYCPDRHIVYDGRTPDEVGVGGGVTARVRLARALARAGHQVVNIVNCSQREEVDGVEYLPLDRARSIEADVLVLNTSGGAYDLRPILGLDCSTRLQLVWVHGTATPHGLSRIHVDGFVAVSNFVAGVIQSSWEFADVPIFVAYNGFEHAHFAEAERELLARDPYRLIYTSHPSKGLDTAIDVVLRLRAFDRRYHLTLFGGARLWGQPEDGYVDTAGVLAGGLIGQRALARELARSTFSIQLQDRPEPGALAIVDALRAGCVVLASPVGCYPEMILNAVNGVLVEGDHMTAQARGQAVEAIRGLHTDHGRLERLSRSARSLPWSSDMMARVWSQYFEWRLEGERKRPESECARCGSTALALEDGRHCTRCGHYELLRSDGAGGGRHG